MEKRNTANRLILGILIAIILFFGVFNHGNSDYDAYEKYYNSIVQPVKEDYKLFDDYGYNAIMYCCAKAGISFPVFRGMLIIATIFFLFEGVRRLDDVSALAALAYFIFPFLIDAVQLRFFFAYSLVVYALPLLKDKRRIAFAISVLIAATFHFSAIAYLALLLATLDDKKLKIVLPILLVLEIATIALCCTVLYPYLIGISNRFGSYFRGNNIKITDFIRRVLFPAVFPVLTFVIFRGDRTEKDETTTLLCKLAFVSMLFVPLVVFGLDYYRLVRGMIIIYYLLMTKEVVKIGKHNLNWLIILCYAVICFLFEFASLSNIVPRFNTEVFRDVVVDTFTKNYFVDWIRASLF